MTISLYAGSRGSSEYIKIPREDTYVFNEKTTSAYLYDRADYEIVDQYDKHVRLSKGEEIKTYFSNRTGKKYSKVKLSNSEQLIKYNQNNM